MMSSPLTRSIEHVSVVGRRGRVAMAVVFAGAGVAVAARFVAPWISLGLVAGVLVLGCLAVCVFTAIYDERSWRAVQHELDKLGRQRRSGP